MAPVGHRSASLSISLGAGSSALLVRILKKKKTKNNNNLWVCGQPNGLSKGCGQPKGLSMGRHIHRGSAHEKRPNVMGSSGYKKYSRTASNLSNARSRVGASCRKNSAYHMVGDRGCVVGNRKNAHVMLLKVFRNQPNQRLNFYQKHKDF